MVAWLLQDIKHTKNIIDKEAEKWQIHILHLSCKEMNRLDG
jgi:hypothetical protein